MSRKTLPGLALLVLFVALLATSIFMARGLGFEDEPDYIAASPAWFVEITYRMRLVIVCLFCFAVIGVCASVGILRRRRWGWLSLAWLFSLTCLALLTIRLYMAPRYVTDPNWNLVIALALAAGYTWWHILNG